MIKLDRTGCIESEMKQGLESNIIRNTIGTSVLRYSAFAIGRGGTCRLDKILKVSEPSEISRGNIVFVHGLGGHPLDTWKNSDNDGFWPNWLAKEFAVLSVFLLSYSAPKTNWFGQGLSLEDRAVSVFQKLATRDDLFGKPTVFVCHSLGGLLVKQLMRQATEQAEHSEDARIFLENTAGVVFIATPHVGSNIANLAERLRMLVWPSNSTLDLTKNNAKLRHLNLWFRNWSNRPKSLIFYETLGIGISAVVDPASSDAGLQSVIPIPVERDHAGICKPPDKEDIVFSATRRFIEEALCDSHSAGHETNLICVAYNPTGSNVSFGGVGAKILRLAFLCTFLAVFALGGVKAFDHIQKFFVEDPITRWLDVASAARESKVLRHDRPIPAEVSVARASFETWWQDTTLAEKREVEPNILFEALSFNSRIYRISEKQSEAKPSATLWADRAIEFFEQTQNTYYLVESLTDKSAIYLELSQIEHTDPESFLEIAQDGDAVISRAFSLADTDQRSTILRIWSRFYYNLARPKEGELHQNWSNDYLLPAYSKMLEAYELDPDEAKNASQLARVTHRAAANPPHNLDPIWTERLRYSQDKLLKAWRDQEQSMTTAEQRIPKINVLATMTMDVVGREWGQSEQDSQAAASEFVSELENVALPLQREVIATIGQTEWEEDYDFDIHYDIGRIRSLMVQILLTFDEPKAEVVFGEALQNMEAAAAKASSIQRSSAYASVLSDPNMANLPETYRDQIRGIFRIN